MTGQRKKRHRTETNTVRRKTNGITGIRKVQALGMLEDMGVNTGPLEKKHVATLTSMVRKLIACNQMRSS